MKTEELKAKALSLFINNVSLREIARQCETNAPTVTRWKNEYGWEEFKALAKAKTIQNVTDQHAKIIQDQVRIAELANKELIKRLKTPGDERTSDIVNIMKHGLDVVRPSKGTEINMSSSGDNVAYSIEVLIPEDDKDQVEAEPETTGSVPNPK